MIAKLVGTVAGLIIIVSLIGLGYRLASDDYEDSAIRSGVGEYYLNDKHEKQFHWKGAKQ